MEKNNNKTQDRDKPSLSLDINTGKNGQKGATVWTTNTHPPNTRKASVSFQLNGDHAHQDTSVKFPMNGESKKRSEDATIRGTPPVVLQRLSFTEKYLSWRYVLVMLLQTSFVVLVILRNSIAMALVCMTAQPGSAEVSFVNSSSYTDGVSRDWQERDNNSVYIVYRNVTQIPVSDLEFSWSSQVQGLVLTATMFLSPLAPLLPNIIKTFFNIRNKHIMTATNMFAAAVTFLSPIAARISPYYLVALRVMLGLVQGTNVPIIGDMIAWWAPQDERLSMVGLTFVGINIGGVLASLLSGFLCGIPIDNGWPFIFYVSGGLTLLWGAAWHFLSTEKPEEHPYISDFEKEYILFHRAQVEDESEVGKKGRKPPYKQMLTSVPLLGFLATACCHFWSTNIVFTYMPSYFVTILGFNVQQAGILVSSVAFIRMFGTLIWTSAGNLMAARKISTRMIRKVCIGTGFIISSFAMIGMAFLGKSERWLAYGVILFGMISQACGTSHLTAVPQDMAPRYAGLVTGMFVSIGSLVSISGPLVISNITTNGTEQEWMVVWLILGGVFIFGTLCFCFLGNASVQPWARVNRKSVQIVPSTLVNMGKRLSTFMDRPPTVTTIPPPMMNGNSRISIGVEPPDAPNEKVVQDDYDSERNEDVAQNMKGGHENSIDADIPRTSPCEVNKGQENEAYDGEDVEGEEPDTRVANNSNYGTSLSNIIEITRL